MCTNYVFLMIGNFLYIAHFITETKKEDNFESKKKTERKKKINGSIHHYRDLLYDYTVEPHYNEVLGPMKITLLYQVSHYIRVKHKGI